MGLTPYPLPTALRSAIILNPSDGVPPTDDLEAAQEELKALRARLLERSRKAGQDIKAIEESMRRMKEKERGLKAKDKERGVKKELDASSPWADSIPSESEDPQPTKLPRGRPPLHSKSQVPRHSVDRSIDDKQKKKKRKRDIDYDDSDVEIESQRPRKSTPLPSNTSHPHHPTPSSAPPPPPPKAQKTITVPHVPKLTPAQGPDFTLPTPHQFLPTRPPIHPPPVAGPSKPIEVTEDFSKLKPPNQVPATTFYTAIEPYTRGIREEDIGFLEHTADEVEPYVMPKLGRHYPEVWEEQDSGVLSAARFEHPAAPAEYFEAPDRKWDPSTLNDVDVLTESKGHGPLTERVISALVPMEDHQWKGVKAAEDAMEGRPGGSGAAASKREKMNVGDLEVRIRDTMRYHGLLNDIPDYTNKTDDPIASALRQAQSELRLVVARNKARKHRLAEIARDRLAYQEYLENRDALDRNIMNMYHKLQKKDLPKPLKKKKPPPKNANNSSNNGEGEDGDLPPGGPCPAALGLGPDVDNHLVVPEQLKKLVELRRQWVDRIGAVFDAKQEEEPGRIYGIPTNSVFEGLEEDVERIMAQGPSLPSVQEVPSTGGGSSKGKGKAKEDKMDVG